MVSVCLCVIRSQHYFVLLLSLVFVCVAVDEATPRLIVSFKSWPAPTKRVARSVIVIEVWYFSFFPSFSLNFGQLLIIIFFI